MERAEGRGVDRVPAWTREGSPAARLGCLAEAELVDPGAKAAPSAFGHARRTRGTEKNIAETVAAAAAQHPDKPVEVWATDEHRLGLKPVLRRVWAPVGERPIALGHHRYQWLHLTAFVEPTGGETVWYLSTGISKPFFEALLAKFAEETGAGLSRIIVLVLDNAGWHGPANLSVPEGIKLVFLPPYSPELQPAECLWPLVDEPIVNKYFETLAELDQAVAERCRRLDNAAIKAKTAFSWWPKPTRPN